MDQKDDEGAYIKNKLGKYKNINLMGDISQSIFMADKFYHHKINLLHISKKASITLTFSAFYHFRWFSMDVKYILENKIIWNKNYLK